MKFLSIFFFLVLFIPIKPFAQELNCNVTVVSPRVEATEKRIYDNMRKTIMEFMRNTVWTNDKFEPNERIECNVYITIEERVGTDKFRGNLQVQCVRPIFNSSYNSPIFNYLDKDLVFEYIEHQQIEYTPGSFSNNLSAILAFYSFIFIGLDYDSYGKLAGTPYLDKAQEIVNQAQGTEYPGWEAFTTKKNNRYWLINQLLDNPFRPMREVIYEYHRLGLDLMYEEPDKGRATISEALQDLRKVHRDEPNSFLMQVFFDAKREEIIKIFMEGTSSEKEDLLTLVKEIDAANSSKYSDKIKP
jgi:hypothetical protein